MMTGGVRRSASMGIVTTATGYKTSQSPPPGDGGGAHGRARLGGGRAPRARGGGVRSASRLGGPRRDQFLRHDRLQAQPLAGLAEPRLRPEIPDRLQFVPGLLRREDPAVI